MNKNMGKNVYDIDLKWNKNYKIYFALAKTKIFPEIFLVRKRFIMSLNRNNDLKIYILI